MIHFFIQYNDKIIYLSLVIIFLLGTVVIWWQVFGAKSDGVIGNSEIDLSSIEDSLKKILTQTNQQLAQMPQTPASNSAVDSKVSESKGAAPAAPPTAAPIKLEGFSSLDGQPLTDVDSIRSELQVRAKLIEDLQKKVKNAAKGDGASEELLGKIKDLEGRLAEYEIIEDDIADLSFFKEENAKLKKELESLTRADPKMLDRFADELAAEGASKTSEDSAQTTPVDLGMDDLMASMETSSNSDKSTASAEEVKSSPAGEQSQPSGATAVESKKDESTVEPELAKEDQPEVTAAESPDIASGDQPDLVAALAGENPSETVLSTESAIAKPTAQSARSTSSSEEGNADIFGEFAQEEGSSDPLAELGDIDPDRMLDELKDLNADATVGAEALDEEADIDKLADEADSMQKRG